MSKNIELQNKEQDTNELEAQKAQDVVKVKAMRIQPDCDIEEAEKDFIVRVDMPGLDPAGIDVKLDKDILTVEATAEIEGLRARHYFRQFRVMRGLDASQCQADYKLGVLTLKLAKPAVAQSQQIKVSYV